MQRGQTQYTKAIDAQLDLLRYYSGDAARQFFMREESLNALGYAKGGDIPESRRSFGWSLLGVIQTQLVLATPIYVAPHIANMLEDSVSTFPGDIIIQATDFPTKCGFVFLDSEWCIGETPAGSIDYMTAFGWAISPTSAHILIYGPNRVPGHPTHADDVNQLNQFDVWNFGEPYDYDAALEAVASMEGGLTVTWQYIDQYGNVSHKDILQSEAATIRYMQQITARKMVYSVLHFMQQKIVAGQRRNMPRESRRRLPKEYVGDPVVQVITLRGYEESLHPYEIGAELGAEAAREWRSRWVVRGHWRKQWYASEQAHKPIWIDAYVKGPDGLPVKNATKLFAVTR